MTAVELALPSTVAELFREIGDLKRVRVAHAEGSVAQRSFLRCWTALAAGVDPGRVARLECAAALAGARLAGIDAEILVMCGVTGTDAVEVLGRAIHEVAGGLPLATLNWVGEALSELVERATATSSIVEDAAGLPVFVGALCRQPRAGATAPGRPRLLVEPPENHAEHCWAVAVYGALLAEGLGADPGEVFLLGLAHHLHNAVLPDAGFAGDVLLGDRLEALLHRLTEQQLATLPASLETRVRALLALRAHADTPVGQAFHAADVLDRVLQVHHHARAAGFTVEQALVDLQLVHAGPVTAYQHAVLAAAGL
jgi:5'-deoxynucleotidase YfbR-like HD superfamily hydrolase